MIQSLFLLPIAIACFSVALVDIMASEGMIFSPLRKVIYKRLGEQLSKPLITCAYCVAGQWALWSYVFTNFTQFNFFEMVGAVGVSIISVGLIKRVV